MARLIRVTDWSATPLGPIASWPQPLRTVVDLMLAASSPRSILWGQDRIQLYNDAYILIAAERHPYLLGRPAGETWPEAYADFLGPIFERVHQGHSVVVKDQPVRLRRADGEGFEERFFTAEFIPIRDGSGAVGGVFHPLLETTDRVLAERDNARLLAEQRSVTKRLQQLFEQAPGGMSLQHGPEHVFVMANEVFRRLAGHRELIGKTAREAFPDLQGQGFFENLDKAYAAGKTVIGHSVRAHLHDAPGAKPREVYVDVAYQPVVEVDGRVAGVFIQVNDVTAHHRALEALGESQERFRLAAESSSLGTYEIDPHAQTIVLSASVARLYGLAADRAVPLAAVFDRIHAEDREPMRALLARVLTPDGHDEYAYAHRVIGPDGRLCWLDARARVRFEPDQAGALHAVQVIGVAWDVTEHRQLVESLRQADRTKDEFLATLAHELRNPLAPLRNVASLLKRSGPSPAQQPLLAIMDRQVGQLRRLVDDLLEVSRITQGKIALKREPMRISGAVYAALEAIQPMIEQRGQLFETRVSSTATVDIDAARITQVVTNLLNNASKFTPEGGRITLEAFDEDGAVLVRVRDEGVGIAPEVLPRVFELFAQGAATTTDQAQAGLGIGLSLVKRLVEMHGGTVQAHSDGLGQGACFAVRLPCSERSVGRS